MIRLNRTSTLTVAIGAMIASLMVAAGTAMAQSPTEAQYGDRVPGGGGGGPGGGGGSGGDPSQLAFTGLDALTFAVIGLVLLGVGFAAHRLSRTRQNPS